MGRIDKENYYLDIAQTVAERATCLRRRYGAILVKSDEIIATGYNGAPRGRKNCVDLNYCTRVHLLRHVPPAYHQRRHPAGGHPQHQNGLLGGPCGGLDPGGRLPTPILTRFP